MTLPLGDWQFWAVTLIALAAGTFLLRGVVPEGVWRWLARRLGVRRAGGPGRRRSARATLTIDGRRVR